MGGVLLLLGSVPCPGEREAGVDGAFIKVGESCEIAYIYRPAVIRPLWLPGRVIPINAYTYPYRGGPSAEEVQIPQDVPVICCVCTQTPCL